MGLDRVYSKINEDVKPFTFNQEVAVVFQNMIERSVPGYAICLEMITLLSKKFLLPGKRVYDLGCSLGASLIAVAKAFEKDPLQLIGVDNSASMLKECRTNLGNYNFVHTITLLEADVETITLSPCSAVVLNFTLQFVPLENRDRLIKKIYEALLPNGILILSEKIDFPDQETTDIFSTLHQRFKLSHGYTDLEISQKRTALENVLVPETADLHLKRLQKVGFKQCIPWFQCLNFASYFAIKKS